MSLRMVVDATAWRRHLMSVQQVTAGLVPVAKGNGYGFGIGLLTDEAAALGVDTLAVGTYPELDASAGFPGTRLVLSPWRPFLPTPTDDPKVVHTVSRLDDLARLAALPHRPRVVVEVLTSMRRHGIAVDRLAAAGPMLDGVAFEGWTMHLPMTGDTTAEAARLARTARGVVDGPVWVSHVPAQRRGEIGGDVRMRVGTNLWLGDAALLQVRSHVLDVHRLGPGEGFGYRQRSLRRGGTLLVVSGGTAHGIALTAPTPATTMRQRGVAAADGGLQALGRARSPFVVNGQSTWFAEPPHMQCSMIVAPGGASLPSVGDEVPVRVRHTTTLVDEVVLA
ncbi:MAG: alanine racemase [Jiangellales bacterium]